MTSQWELYESIHEATHEAIADCRWYDWDEDFITRTILRSLRGIHVTVQPTDDMPVQIEIRPWKLTGNREATFGDIAILVNISFHDGTCLEGAAFLAWIFA
jgi:hypothetical protein